jgi:transcriptional regulator with XRE-family HTH domain
MTLRDRVEARLTALEMTPRAASVKAGLNTHFLQAILSGKTRSPTTDNLEKLASALETTPEWLLTGAGDPNQPVDPPTAEVIKIMPALDERRKAELAQYARFLAEQAKRDKL